MSGVDNQTFTRLNAAYKNTNYSLAANNNILLPETNQNIYYANIGQAMVTANEIQLAANSEELAPVTDSNLKPAALVTTTAANPTSTFAKQSPDDNLTVDAANIADASRDNNISTSSNVKLSVEDNQALENLLDKLDPQEKNTISVAEAAKPKVVTKVAFLAKNRGSGFIKYTVNPGDTLYS
ncbi:MAG: hypothetical protein K0R49_1371, partial [Burkholderiales bacterium]|nr:hypothetical protein [Burkholderiales bacterium]